MKLLPVVAVVAALLLGASVAGVLPAPLPGAAPAPGAPLGGQAGIAMNPLTGSARVAMDRAGAPSSLALDNTLGFVHDRVDATSDYWDMYEPAITVAPTGVMYVSGHSLASNAFRSIAFFSTDRGITWQKLPDVEDIALPMSNGVGNGDEGVIAADGQGNAWLYDSDFVAGTSFLYQWCGDGARLCHIEPLAHNMANSALQGCGPRTIDKPWTVAGAGKVVLTNNAPGTGLNPDTQLVVGLLDAQDGTIAWNDCAGVGGRPGFPSIRDTDGMMAIPQVRGPPAAAYMAVVQGTGVDQLTEVAAFPTFGDWVVCEAFNGFSDFDAQGTYFVAGASRADAFTVAASADLQTFARTEFQVEGTVHFAWVAGSLTGAGALVMWAVSDPDDCMMPDYYVAHAYLEGGQVVLRDATLVAAALGPQCGHYMGAAVDPEGRAYLVALASPGACLGPLPEYPPGTHKPIHLFRQENGPTL